MAVDKSKKPYYNDYNEEKHFHEMLFRPSRAVQTRELNQLQTYFYQQINRFADNVFDDGSMVIPGETSYDLSYSYIKVSVDNYDNIKNLLNNEGVHIVGRTTGVKADIARFEPPYQNDPSTFYLKYTSGGQNGEAQLFQVGERVNIFDSLENTIGTALVNENGIGSKFTVADGVYYVNGRFILVPTSTVLLDKYSNAPSYSVGFIYNESVVTSIDDNSLLDNAQGSSNVSAPGADRLRIDLTLTKIPLEELSSAPEDYVEIFRIENGNVQKKARGPDYNILEDTLARRTYDESGDYTVNPFNIQVKEHLKEDDNDGVYLESEGGDESKYVVQVSSGKAYVRGYEIENLSSKNISVDKARDTEVLNNASIAARLGYYIEINEPNNVPDISSFQSVDFLDSSDEKIGEARVKFFQKVDSRYRLYVFDVKDASGSTNTKFISNVRAVSSNIGAPFVASVDEEYANLRGTAYNSLMFQLPANFVKTLLNESGQTDTTFTTVRQYNTFVATNGNVILTAPTNETFLAQDPQYCMASFTDDGELVSPSYSLGGSPLGKTINFQIGSEHAGRPIRINVVASKQQAVQKSKAVSTTNRTISSEDNGKYSLGKADVFDIVSVVDNNDRDVTSSFVLYHNKKPEYYGVSYIVSDNSTTFELPLTVRFSYFEHSSGDFFSVDSYAGIDYKDIPNEGDIYLTDVIDFRPRMDDSGTGFTGQGSTTGNIPIPYSVIRSDIEYYMPRNDMLYLKSDGQFGVIKGVSSNNPKDPAAPESSMPLYIMEIPAYTPVIDDVRSRKVSTRRYTMKDIGKLDNRISNLEYYVSLNLLEKSAADMQVVDETTGLNRFKNGFLVDSFVDHSIGDYGWSEYHCSIGEGDLRPEFSLNAVDLEIDFSNSSGIRVNNGIATLDYDEVEYISQNSRTNYINVNPYAVFRWQGNLVLDPAVDNWIDTVYTDPSVTYKVYNNGKLTQSWNSWQLNWSSGSTSTSKDVASKTILKDEPHGRRQNVLGLSSATGDAAHTAVRLDAVTVQTTTTTTNVDVVNDRILSTNVIPYMRSREVEVTGKGHKPNTRMYFFFDGTNVDAYVKPSSGSYGTKVVTDDDGNFESVFKIPNTSSLKFTTGTKPLVVTDESSNQREYSLSYSEAKYSATGTKETRQKTIVATRSTETSFDTDYRTTTWWDPIAQSFLVEQNGGVFMTAIEVFFKSKDEEVPINIDIREMENGQPTQRIVPGSKVTLNPSEVDISDDGSIATKFEFGYPIYLQESVEYCFVLTTNSNNYNAFISTMGEKDLQTGKYISKQPYVGVMFKSQNASTWTEDQTSDIQFKMYRAKFKTGSFTMNLVNKDIEAINPGLDRFYTESGSSTIKLNYNNHNYVVGSLISVQGADGGNGIDASVLNKVHKVSRVIDPNNVEFIMESTTEGEQDPVASDTGRIGGSSSLVSNTVQASLLNLNSGDILFPETNIAYFAKGTTGKSIDGSETPYTAIDGWVQVENNEHYALGDPWLITNRADEGENFSNNRTLKVQALMSSTNENISPVIDLQRINVITPFYMIDGDLTNEEADGSNTYAKYRTNISGLNEAATSIKMYADINQPQESDVIVSARFGNSNEEVSEAEWVNLQPSTDGDTSSNQFLENEFSLDDIGDYTYFQVMIQMKSKSAANVPVIRKMRILALGT